jgi:ATP-dependent DNA ligase
LAFRSKRLAFVRPTAEGSNPRVAVGNAFAFRMATFKIMNIVKGKVGFIEPMLAVAVTKLPEGPAWTYELKFDAYRALGLTANGKVRLLSRNGINFTSRFASIAKATQKSATSCE